MKLLNKEGEFLSKKLASGGHDNALSFSLASLHTRYSLHHVIFAILPDLTCFFYNLFQHPCHLLHLIAFSNCAILRSAHLCAWSSGFSIARCSICCKDFLCYIAFLALPSSFSGAFFFLESSFSYLCLFLSSTTFLLHFLLPMQLAHTNSILIW
jgi:hypothetical protein